MWLERFRGANKKTSLRLYSTFNSPMGFLLCYCKLALVYSRSSAPTGLFINYILFVDSLAVNKFHPPLKSWLVTLSFSSALFDYLRYSSPAIIDWFYRGPGLLAVLMKKKMSLLLSLPACRRSSFWREWGGVGEQPNHMTARKPGPL
jgi:hypothetical protein